MNATISFRIHSHLDPACRYFRGEALGWFGRLLLAALAPEEQTGSEREGA